MGQKHLTLVHRELLVNLSEAGISKRAIARILGYSETTIYKELRRNKNCEGKYVAATAQHKADERRRKARRCHKQTAFIVEYVTAHLAKFWSPEQIAGRMRREMLPETVCFKTIYRWVKNGSYSSRPTVFTGYAKYLRIKSAGKSLGRRATPARQGFKDLPGIETRPEDSSFGCWEADLIHGHNRSGYILSMVERSTGFLALCYCVKKDISSVNMAIEHIFKNSYSCYRRSITYDRGKEFYGYKEIEEKLGFKSYFCRPNSPQDKALNENTNGLLRQFFPRRMNFRTLTGENLAQAARLINDRPRKKFGFKTTVEVLVERGLWDVLTFV